MRCVPCVSLSSSRANAYCNYNTALLFFIPICSVSSRPFPSPPPPPALQIINLLDFLLGITLCAFGFMLFDKLGQDAMTNPLVSWLCWLSTIIGVLLLLSW
jgi:hypothetical protein